MARSVKGLAAKSDREPEFDLGTQMEKGSTPQDMSSPLNLHHFTNILIIKMKKKDSKSGGRLA